MAPYEAESDADAGLMSACTSPPSRDVVGKDVDGIWEEDERLEAGDGSDMAGGGKSCGEVEVEGVGTMQGEGVLEQVEGKTGNT